MTNLMHTPSISIRAIERRFDTDPGPILKDLRSGRTDRLDRWSLNPDLALMISLLRPHAEMR